MAINLYKPFSVKYLERLGGSNLHITLYNSLPGIVAAAVLFPGIMLLAKFKNKKIITAVFIFIARLTIFAMAFISLFPAAARPIIFVGLISFLNFPEAISQTSMQSFLGNIFGGKVRALAISTRNQFGNFFIMVVTLVTGLIISYLPNSEPQRMLCYKIFFVMAFIFGVAEVVFFLRLDEKHNPDFVEEQPEAPKFTDVKAIFTDKKFMAFTACTILFYVAYHGGWAVSSIYTIKNLGANEFWLALFAVISGLVSFFSATVWNKIISKKGNNTALVWACYTLAVNTFTLAISANLYALLFQSIINGVGSIGITITLLNGLLISTPNKNRLLYIGIYNTFVNLSLGISPLIIQAFMDITSVRATLFFIAALRAAVATILAYVLLRRKKEKEIF